MIQIQVMHGYMLVALGNSGGKMLVCSNTGRNIWAPCGVPDWTLVAYGGSNAETGNNDGPAVFLESPGGYAEPLDVGELFLDAEEETNPGVE